MTFRVPSIGTTTAKLGDNTFRVTKFPSGATIVQDTSNIAKHAEFPADSKLTLQQKMQQVLTMKPIRNILNNFEKTRIKAAELKKIVLEGENVSYKKKFNIIEK